MENSTPKVVATASGETSSPKPSPNSWTCLPSDRKLIPSRCTWVAGLHFAPLLTMLDRDISCSPSWNSSLHPRLIQLGLLSWHVGLEWDSLSCPRVMMKRISREDIVCLLSVPSVGGNLDSVDVFVWFLNLCTS